MGRAGAQQLSRSSTLEDRAHEKEDRSANAAQFSIVWPGVFEMRQIEVSKYEQHLPERATEVLEQMTELKQLRESVWQRPAVVNASSG